MSTPIPPVGTKVWGVRGVAMGLTGVVVEPEHPLRPSHVQVRWEHHQTLSTAHASTLAWQGGPAPEACGEYREIVSIDPYTGALAFRADPAPQAPDGYRDRLVAEQRRLSRESDRMVTNPNPATTREQKIKKALALHHQSEGVALALKIFDGLV